MSERWRNCRKIISETGQHGVLVGEGCPHRHTNRKGDMYANKKDCETCSRLYPRLWFRCENNCAHLTPTGYCRLSEIEIGEDGECRCRTDA